MSARILVLGATGTAGSLTVKKLIEERIPVSIGGRDTGKLQTYSQKYDIESLTIDIGNKDQLKKRFEKYDVIVNCVGPFTLYGYVPLKAAIESKINFVDSAWEQEYFKNIHNYQAAAINSGVTIITGVGVSPGISDMMVSSVCQSFDHINRIAIYYIEGMRNRFSYGTMVSTVMALKSDAVCYSNGKHVPMKIGEQSRTINLRNKYGKQKLISYPGGDIVNIPRYIKTDNVEHYLGMEAMTKLIFLLGKLPLAVDSKITKNAYRIAAMLQKMVFWGHKGFFIQVEIEGSIGGKPISRRLSVCSDDDPYEATATFLVESVKYIIGPNSKPNGILSPGQVLDSGQVFKRMGCSPELKCNRKTCWS